MNALTLGRRRAPRKPRKRVPSHIKAEINVTPLVDVVLVLLVIFMLMAPLLNKDIGVDLPLTQHHDERRDDSRDLVVAMTEGAELFVGSDRVSLEGLGGALTQQLGSQPNRRIVLRADGRSSYGQARRVIEAIHRTGNERIQLGTQPAAERRARQGTEP